MTLDLGRYTRHAHDAKASSKWSEMVGELESACSDGLLLFPLTLGRHFWFQFLQHAIELSQQELLAPVKGSTLEVCLIDISARRKNLFRTNCIVHLVEHPYDATSCESVPFILAEYL